MDKIERGDKIVVNGKFATALSGLGSQMFVRYFDGSTDAVESSEVRFVDRPEKTGAKFLRWEDGWAIYLIPRTNDLARGMKKLKSLGFEIPKTPRLTDWRKLVEDKKRCGRCWRTLRGTEADRANHAATHKI